MTMIRTMLLACLVQAAWGAYRTSTTYAGSGCLGAELYTSFWDAACPVGPISACADSGSTSRKEDCVGNYSSLVTATGYGSYVTSLSGSDCSSSSVRGYSVKLSQCVAISPDLSVFWTCISAFGGSLRQTSYGGNALCGGDPQRVTTPISVCLLNNTLASCNGPIAAFAAMAAVPSILLGLAMLALVAGFI
jgi:hypothetical protein